MDPFEYEDYQPEARPNRLASMNVLGQMVRVFAVAGLLASLFTAWTPLGLVPTDLAGQLVELFWGSSQAEPSVLQPTPRPRPLIGIVAGHSGGVDPGAVCADGLTEVSINLEVATRLKEKLTAAGFDVDLLEEFDERLDGYEALALISVHADSCAYIDDNATGFKIAIAPNSEQSQATRLSACLSERYSRVTGLRFHAGSVSAHMTGYHVFSRIDLLTAAAIVEVGFMNLDRQILTQQPDLLAEGLAQGVLCYIYNEDASGGG